MCQPVGATVRDATLQGIRSRPARREPLRPTPRLVSNLPADRPSAAVLEDVGGRPDERIQDVARIVLVEEKPHGVLGSASLAGMNRELGRPRHPVLDPQLTGMLRGRRAARLPEVVDERRLSMLVRDGPRGRHVLSPRKLEARRLEEIEVRVGVRGVGASCL